MTRLTREELILFREGDETVFRRLVDAFSPRLLAFTRSYAADLDDAHDLLQEAWKRAYEKRATLSGSGTILGWLYTVCRSVCLSTIRARNSRSRVVLDPEMHMGNPPLGPDASAERGELRRSIYEALSELPQRERDVVILRMLEQRSTRETAEQLGCAVGTVKASLHHALAKLQTSMEAWVQ